MSKKHDSFQHYNRHDPKIDRLIRYWSDVGYNRGLDAAISLVKETLRHPEDSEILEVLVCGLESSKKK